MAKKKKKEKAVEFDLSAEQLASAHLAEPHAELVEVVVSAEGSVDVTDAEFVAAPTEEAPAEDAPLDTSNKVTDRGEIMEALEAIIFAAPKAMTLVRLRNLLNSFNYDTKILTEILGELVEKTAPRGFNLVKVAGGYQFRSHPKHSDILQKLLEDRPTRLSASALEVLTIVSYKQPLTRAEIDSVRGTDSGHLLKGLLEKDLARTTGHAETPGRPLLYGTTPYFLEVFSLGSLDELPALDEFKRELGGDDTEAGNDPFADILAPDPAFFDRSSPLAANPDRGAFDAPSEDAEEKPDFGVAERAAEQS